MASDDDDRAYRTDEDMAGRSMRRGVKKGVTALIGAGVGVALGGPIGGLIGAALGNLAKDAAVELGTKVIPRSLEDRDDD